MKLELVDGVPVAHVMLSTNRTSEILHPKPPLSGRNGRVYLDALHCDVVDHSDDASGAGDGQEGVAGVGVVGPSARVEVLVRLESALVKENR